MAPTVRDFEADAVGSGAFAQPPVTYQAGDVVLLLARNASSVGIDLDGEGTMTMLGTESDVYSLWGIVASGAGTASFTYDSASCRLALGVSVYGVTGLPTIVDSDFTTTSGQPSEGQTYSANYSGIDNAVLYLIESICIGDTATIAETSVPAAHDTDGSTIAAVAGGMDVNADPANFTWTFHRNNAPGGSDTKGSGFWELLFPVAYHAPTPDPFPNFEPMSRRVHIRELPHQVSSPMFDNL